MGRIIFNEDPNHFIFTRNAAGIEHITREDLVNFILQYKDTAITDFMVCLNASMPFYNTKRTMNVMDKYKQWLAAGKTDENDENVIVRSIRTLIDIYETQGIPMHALWLDTLRSIHIRPWISIRMNDIHETDREDSILFSDFYLENRGKNRASHRGAAGYYENGLDYMYDSVRAHYLTVIGEALDTFDMDGIELDFMREIYSVGIGREHEALSVMNGFMREVKKLALRAEERLGHKIMIGIRLPDSPEKCLRLGFDFVDYVKSGLVDLITVTPRWSSVDNNMPIDLWHRILDGTGVTLAAGLEILLDAYNRRGRKYNFNTLETAVGSACAYLSMGADAIYLFNYMDVLTPDSQRDDSLLSDPEKYRTFLTAAGDIDRSAALPRRHVVTYDDVYAVGVSGAKQLPMGLYGDGVHTPSFGALRIPTGIVPAGKTVTAVLGIAEGEDFDGDGLTVYLNAKKCRFVGVREPIYPQYTDVKYYAFEAENDGELPTVSVLEAGLVSGRCTVHWAELQIN